MKRYVILSVNDRIDYQIYLPLTVWAWRQIGWTPIVFYCGYLEDKRISARVFNESTLLAGVDLYSCEYTGEYYESATIAQISRLYAGCLPLLKDGYLMTSDCDMLPLSDFWKYDENDITVWGHDLTGYGHIPICYVGMKASRWIEVMGLTGSDYDSLIKRDLDSMPNASSHDPAKRWCVDQDLITERINAVSFPKKFINRGVKSNGYAVGRVDRSGWDLADAKFDCHMLRDIFKPTDQGYQNYARTMRLLDRVWPNENFNWFEDYVKEFRKLTTK